MFKVLLKTLWKGLKITGIPVENYVERVENSCSFVLVYKVDNV
jgi:hypothetical protein